MPGMPYKNHFLLVSTVLFSGCLSAAETGDAKAPVDVATELLNPIGRLAAVDNRFFFKSFQGDLPDAGGQTTSGYVFEPVIPFELSNGRRLAVRFSLPMTFSTPAYRYEDNEYADWLIRQRADVLEADGRWIEGHGHLDDITYDIAYGDTEDDGLFWMVGLAGALPTSQDGSIERDQYQLGPQAAIGKTYEWGIIGAWGKHLVDAANSSRAEKQRPIDWNTSETRIRLIFAYKLADDWQIVSNPEFIYDWEGVSDNKILLPLGGGVARSFDIGRMPLRASLEFYYYAVSPEAFGPEWQLNFSLMPVISAWSLN